MQHEIRITLPQRLAEQGQVGLQLCEFAIHVSDGLWLLVRVVAVFLLFCLVFLEVNLENLAIEED